MGCFTKLNPALENIFFRRLVAPQLISSNINQDEFDQLRLI